MLGNVGKLHVLCPLHLCVCVCVCLSLSLSLSLSLCVLCRAVLYSSFMPSTHAHTNTHMHTQSTHIPNTHTYTHIPYTHAYTHSVHPCIHTRYMEAGKRPNPSRLLPRPPTLPHTHTHEQTRANTQTNTNTHTYSTLTSGATPRA